MGVGAGRWLLWRWLVRGWHRRREGGRWGRREGSGGGALGLWVRGPDWLPCQVPELGFSCLQLSELRSCALMCKRWHRCLHSNENSEVLQNYKAKVMIYQFQEFLLRVLFITSVWSY